MGIYLRHRYRLLLHLLAASVVCGMLMWFVFSVYLPSETLHGETVTVPNVVGMQDKEAVALLASYDFVARIAADSDYSIHHAASAVLKQIPEPKRSIKSGRSILLILNAKQPPRIAMPNLIDGSVKQALLLLRSHKLRIGTIRYLPDLAQNAVLAQYIKGKPIAAGQHIPQGSQIDLDVGDGYGRLTFATPNILGIAEEEAEAVVISTGLRIRGKHYQSDGRLQIYRQRGAGDSLLVSDHQLAAGLVFAQNPAPETPIRIGDAIEFWVVGTPPQSAERKNEQP